MNTLEKEKQQKLIIQNLEGIDFATKAAVKVKDAHRAKMLDLTMNGAKTYSANNVEIQMNKAKDEFDAKMVSVNNDIVKRLDELQKLINDRDSVLDLSNTGLTNALSLIQTVGAGLSYEDCQKINLYFQHDLSALRAIRAGYLSHGIAANGNIDDLIYDIDYIVANLKELALNGFVRDGNINFFAFKLSEFGKLEGATIEKTPDPQGFEDAISRGAGLKIKA